MNARRSLWSVVVAAIFLVASGRASSQSDEGKRTPRPDDVRPPITNPEEGLTRRLGKDRELNDVEKTVQKILAGLSDKDKEDIVRRIQSNPTLQKQLTDELRNNKDLRDKLVTSAGPQNLTDEQKQLLSKAAGLVEKPPVTPPPNMGTNTDPVVPMTPKTEPMTAPDPKPGTASLSTPGSAEVKPKAEEPTGLNKLLKGALPKAADLMAKLGLAEDADFLRSLLRGKMPDDNNGYLAQVARKGMAVVKELPLEKMLSGDFSSVVGNVHLPELPHFNLPFGGDSAPGNAGGSSPGVSVEGTGMALFWILVLIVFAVFLWKGKELFIPSSAKTAGEWKLGPWPVRPEGVRTRADLVKAFEYLAFLVLGLAARPRNHLDLASNLADTGTEPGRQSAADRLARLYEHARYAPAEEALPEDELRAARHDLTFLAGVGRA